MQSRRFRSFLFVAFGASTAGCTIPGHLLDGGGGDGSGTPCQLSSSDTNLNAPILIPSVPFAVGTTISAAIAGPGVIGGASTKDIGILVKAGVACVADPATPGTSGGPSELPIEVTTLQVGTWQILLNAGEMVPVDVRQPANIETTILNLGGKREGEISAGDEVSIVATLTDRSHTTLATGDHDWSFKAVQGGVLRSPLTGTALIQTGSFGVSQFGAMTVSAPGHYQIDVSALGIHRLVEFDVVP